ncbi:MAG: carboxypeptidase-like regulatory domain-containing protein [Jatrophihabitantaceae bacterium]
MRRALSVSATLLALLAALVVLAVPASAVRTAGWATWTPITGTSNNYRTTMQLPANGFPRADVATDSRANVQLPSGDSTFLSTSTAVGFKYGSSRGSPYLVLRPKADTPTAPSTTTYTFENPTPDTGWAFVLGDIDADKVQVSAKDASGTPLTAAQIDQWKAGHDVFNYAGGTDVPTWDAATSTLTGNAGAVDTNGASAWFEPDISISSLSFVFTRRSGFPVYQTWFASLARTISGTVGDVSTGANVCPIDDTVVRLTGPHGDELATTKPVNGAYTFGQYATQAGYLVSIEQPSSCAVVGPDERTVSTAASDITADFSLRQVVPQPVSGTVRNPAHDPVAGVEITLTPPAGPAKVITTEADGKYLFDGNAELPGYHVAVTGVPAGFRTDPPASLAFDIPIGTPVTGKDFTVSELPSVSGTVTGGGQPLGGVTVTRTPTGGGPAVTAVTNGDGTYTFDHVPAGSYDIAVTPPTGYRPTTPRTDVSVAGSDRTGQDFDLSRPGALGGQVIDRATGTGPGGGTTLTVHGPGGNRTLHTESDGSYFLGGLEPGQYVITVGVPSGYAAVGVTSRTVLITAQGEIRGGQNFVVEPTFAATGTVTDGGAPVPGIDITLTAPGGDVVARTTTGTDGRFSVPGLVPAAGYTATVTPPPGFAVDGRASITFTVAGAEVSGLDFVLTATTSGSGGGSELADTGPHTDGELLLAVALLGAGLALTAAARPRRR